MQTRLLYNLFMKSLLSSSFRRGFTRLFMVILSITLGTCQCDPRSGILFHTSFMDLPYTCKFARIPSVLRASNSLQERNILRFFKKDIHTPMSNYRSNLQLSYLFYPFLCLCQLMKLLRRGPSISFAIKANENLIFNRFCIQCFFILSSQ